MNEIIGRTSVGTIGFISSIGLQQVNEVLSALVALCTIIYLITGIKKNVKK
tara:strand:- start:97 stop:249 length:153 start_codon:yes stop_codon:yes gene_type:complete